MTKLPSCPWCGCDIAKVIDAKKGYVEWGCGSFKRGPEPYQADSCRILQLEIQREKLQARTDVLGDADTTIAKLKAENEQLKAVLKDVAKAPYPDYLPQSDPASLLETLRSEARAVLAKTGFD